MFGRPFPAAEGTRAPRPLKENESAEEFQVEITANSDPAMDVDSGYAYSGEAIETPKPAKTGKTTTKTKDTRRKLIESPTPGKLLIRVDSEFATVEGRGNWLTVWSEFTSS